ncbi:MAG: amidohydrolase family protein [Planctomycetaceae bacterium]
MTRPVLRGAAEGFYEYSGTKVEVLADGPIVVSGQLQILAGSSRSTAACVAHAAQAAELTLGQAWELAARNPARLLGFEVVRLARGARADLTIFDYAGEPAQVRVRGTIAGGQVVHGESEIKSFAA